MRRTFCLPVRSECLEMYKGQLCSSFLFFLYKWKSGSSEKSGRKEANVHLSAEMAQRGNCAVISTVVLSVSARGRMERHARQKKSII